MNTPRIPNGILSVALLALLALAPLGLSCGQALVRRGELDQSLADVLAEVRRDPDRWAELRGSVVAWRGEVDHKSSRYFLVDVYDEGEETYEARVNTSGEEPFAGKVDAGRWVTFRGILDRYETGLRGDRVEVELLEVLAVDDRAVVAAPAPPVPEVAAAEAPVAAHPAEPEPRSWEAVRAQLLDGTLAWRNARGLEVKWTGEVVTVQPKVWYVRHDRATRGYDVVLRIPTLQRKPLGGAVAAGDSVTYTGSLIGFNRKAKRAVVMLERLEPR